MKLSLIHESIIINDVGLGVKVLSCNSEQGYDRSQSTPAAIHKRSLRNQARRKMEKEGRVKKGDNKHINHKQPLSKGGTNSPKNLEVSDAKSNWSEGRRISAANQRKKSKK